MSNSTNMNLPIPVVGTTPGPDWAANYNGCFNIIDAHDHTPGNGVQITPSGMNINNTLTFNSNIAADLLKITFTSQTVPLTGTNFISFSGGNLYVNDGSGNQVQITSGGGVAGSPGSIGSLSAPASATYSSGSKLFTWKADSTKAAAMDNGAVTIRETNVASAKGITVQSPTSLGADYNLTLLTGLPASTQYLKVSSSGNMGTSTADTISTEITNGAATTLVNRATTTFAISSAIPSFTSQQATLTDITNATATITASGTKLVKIQIIPDPSATLNTSINMSGSSSGSVIISLFINGIQSAQARSYTSSLSSAYTLPLNIEFYDTSLPSGSTVYKLQYETTGGAFLSLSQTVLLVTEI